MHMDKNELKKQLSSLGIEVKGNHIKKKDICSIDFNALLNARFVTKAAPQRVDYLNHDLKDPVKNQEAAKFLKSTPHETILTTLQGELCLFDTALIFFTDDKEYPIAFFYLFKNVMFDGKAAIQEDKIECFENAKDVRIENLPISAYCLFKVLLPRFNIVIGGDQHTTSGEKWSQRQINEAIKKSYHVYLRNDNGDLYYANRQEIVDMNKDYLWGIDPAHRKRLTVISTQPL